MTKSSLNNSKQSSNIKSRLFMSIWKLKILHSVKCLPRQFKDVQQHKSNTAGELASTVTRQKNNKRPAHLCFMFWSHLKQKQIWVLDLKWMVGRQLINKLLSLAMYYKNVINLSFQWKQLAFKTENSRSFVYVTVRCLILIC